jgi:hypothetical protein
MHRLLYWLGIFLALEACSIPASLAAADDITVIGYEGWGNSDLYKPGQKLSADSILQIERCGTLVVRTDDKFVELHGRYQGPLSAYKRQFGCVGGSSTERVTAYDQYFLAVCERQSGCDAVCREVSRLIQREAEEPQRGWPPPNGFGISHRTLSEDAELKCPSNAEK